MNKLILAVPFAVALAFSTPASAQQSGLVNVRITDVDIAKNLNVTAPITVQVPVGVAANVCNIKANVLVQRTKENSDYSCEAENSTQALAQHVSRQSQ